MDTKKNRLDFLRKIRGLTYETLIDDETIVKPSTLRASAHRENDKLDYFLSIIAKKHNVSEDWLIRGIGSMEDVTKINNETSNNIDIKNEGRLTNREFKKTVTIIPMKAQLGLVSSFYAEELMQELETKTIYLEKDYKGKYYEIECDGYSMDNKTDEAIKKGDFVLCREVPKIHWENKLHINDWDFVIFHNERGIIVKRIIEHNTEERKIICHSLNPDKNEYPDFEVYLKDCYAICNIVSVNRNRKR